MARSHIVGCDRQHAETAGCLLVTSRAGHCGHCGHASCLMSISSVSSACVECPGGECNIDRPPASRTVCANCEHRACTRRSVTFPGMVVPCDTCPGGVCEILDDTCGICAGCDGGHTCTGRDPAAAAAVPPPPGFEDDPPADWLMAWASGWMAGHATGYEHGHQDGQQQYAGTLADALRPMRRAAAHGIDVAMARGAWEQHRRRMGGEQDA